MGDPRFTDLARDEQEAVIDRYRRYMSKGDFEYSDIETSAEVFREAIDREVDEK